ncbi:phospholipase D family protein [Paenibacillus lautus]|uniref:phospholipase D family protein n=1 Tax=Paenibacillus lautus TaxID=1401 RepID=UPI00203F9BC7|nr:phospholipase D family protein [Paenibacillus lautus]MCM3261471.1 phospholipase D family protein [Paenibacillus lautus]
MDFRRLFHNRNSAKPPAPGPDTQPLPENPLAKSSRMRKTIFMGLVLLMLWLIGVMIYQTHKPLPNGISYESPVYQSDVKMWIDLTYPGPDGQPVHDQEIGPRIGQIIDESRKFLVIDMFLFNGYAHKDQTFPKVSEELAHRLVTHKKNHPDMDIFFITDEVNTGYGSYTPPEFESMKAAGIHVIVTDVNRLRDSTPAYSAVWRTFIQWFGQSGKGTLPNLMATEAPDITVRSYLKLLNVKANHRKVVISENTALVTSANMHDASAFHSNIAFETSGDIIGDMLAAEQAAVNLTSPIKLPEYEPGSKPAVQPSGQPNGVDVRYLTEGKIYKYVLEGIEQSQPGDTLWMGMFYLADSKVMERLLQASDRGVDIRLILDPNQNAFGRDKIGIPNRPAAAELIQKSKGKISIRWYNTGNEQYHAKLMYIAKPTGKSIITGGSTNFTQRNLDDLNLENNLWIAAPQNHPLTRDLDRYFHRIWLNEDAPFSLDVDAYLGKTTWMKDILFKLQKSLGFTTF